MKQYEEGKFDIADNNRREANRLFDEASESLSTEEGLAIIKTLLTPMSTVHRTPDTLLTKMPSCEAM